MAGIDAKRFDEPDELIERPLLKSKVVTLGEVHVSWTVCEPGWRWSQHLKPVVGTPSCEHHHRGVQLSGRQQIQTDSGASRVIGPGEAFEVPPGHDAWVVGDEPWSRSSSPG